ncbi:hypothetical protein LX32DRAFT_653090 [Colletotrichum zoysiae]|uniref:Uncharacterized protein n=1 Tax=Colletotrichum zoysiae TaxID=1216348 RepID=A0AAD9M4A9_9PEZI|nr:hypothetical protein LX32DRAFT_653090 [Colletotrichum zoysiae]
MTGQRREVHVPGLHPPHTNPMKQKRAERGTHVHAQEKTKMKMKKKKKKGRSTADLCWRCEVSQAQVAGRRPWLLVREAQALASRYGCFGRERGRALWRISKSRIVLCTTHVSSGMKIASPPFRVCEMKYPPTNGGGRIERVHYPTHPEWTLGQDERKSWMPEGCRDVVYLISKVKQRPTLDPIDMRRATPSPTRTEPHLTHLLTYLYLDERQVTYLAR